MRRTKLGLRLTGEEAGRIDAYLRARRDGGAG